MMTKSAARILVGFGVSLAAAALLASAAPRPASGRIVSEHVRLTIPAEREWLGREVIADFERCWRFVHGAVDGKLPKVVSVVVTWETGDTRVGGERVTVGMNHPAALADMKSFLLHRGIAGIARLGLLERGGGRPPREESEFLLAGMAEILAHEFKNSTRNLGGAWVVASFLERMNQLGFAVQSDWLRYSGGRQDLRAAAPGITFLITCRERFGRDRLMKLFENLKDRKVEESLAAAFRTNARVLEEAWLRRVRERHVWENVTVTSEADAPVLERAVTHAAAGPLGSSLELHLFLRDRSNDLRPGNVFLLDELSGSVFQAEESPAPGAGHLVVRLPSNQAPGRYPYKVSAVDEAGNIRFWEGAYRVEAADPSPPRVPEPDVAGSPSASSAP